MSSVSRSGRGRHPGARRGRAGPRRSDPVPRQSPGSGRHADFRSPRHRRDGGARDGSGRPGYRRHGCRGAVRPRARHRPLRRARGGGRVRGNRAAREPHAGRPPSPRPRPAGGRPRIHHRARRERLPGADDQQRHEDADPAARRAAVGHRRHPRADAGPADDQHRRRRALCPRHHPPPGGEQPRPGRHPRQQLLGRLLRRRRPRRRAVLPRPVQPRSRGGPEGAERHDLRPRRRRRRDQSRDQGGRVRHPAGSRPAGRLVRQQARSPRISTSPSARSSRCA